MPETKNNAGSKPLNPKQELFLAYVLRGEPAYKAYREVYKCQKLAAEACSSRLLSNAKVASRLAYLRSKIEKRTILTAQRRYEIINQVAEGEIPETTPSDRLRAVRLDAELRGEIIGKTELSGSDGTPLPSIIPPIIVNIPDYLLKDRGKK